MPLGSPREPAVTPTVIAYAQTILDDYRAWKDGDNVDHPGAAAVTLAEGILHG